MRIIFLLGVAAVATTAHLAAASAANEATGPISYSRDIQPIFNENCVACHQAGSAEQGLVLEDAVSLHNIVQVQSKESAMVLITPGQPDKSYLLAKLDGTQVTAGGKGAQMPLGDPLSPDKIALIRRWVAEGAQSN